MTLSGLIGVALNDKASQAALPLRRGPACSKSSSMSKHHLPFRPTGRRERRLAVAICQDKAGEARRTPEGGSQ
jgi:hypothetical protein